MKKKVKQVQAMCKATTVTRIIIISFFFFLFFILTEKCRRAINKNKNLADCWQKM